MQTNRQIQCKCHGISGSCDVRTCWSALTNFRFISTALKHLYKSAVRVHVPLSRDKGQSQDSTTFAIAIRRATAARRPAAPSSGLVYFQQMRDPCLPDNAHGEPRMRGRVCGNGVSGDAACARTCCGRGHVTRKRTFVDARCRCRFRYCCYVTCEACQQTIEEFVCRWRVQIEVQFTRFESKPFILMKPKMVKARRVRELSLINILEGLATRSTMHLAK